MGRLHTIQEYWCSEDPNERLKGFLGKVCTEVPLGAIVGVIVSSTFFLFDQAFTQFEIFDSAITTVTIFGGTISYFSNKAFCNIIIEITGEETAEVEEKGRKALDDSADETSPAE